MAQSDPLVEAPCGSAPAGPMNWKNPIRVFAVVGWQMFQRHSAFSLNRHGAGFDSLPGFRLCCSSFSAVYGMPSWHFVRRPFPALGENPLLDLMDYHTPTFYAGVMLWYYAAPFVTVMLAGLFIMSIWKVWFESRGRDSAAFGRFQLGRFRRTRRLRKS